MIDHTFVVVAGILDPTSGTDPVLRSAARIAAAAGGVLHVVHVREEEDDAAAPVAADAGRGDEMNAVEPRVTSRHHERSGDAAEAILAVAREVGAKIVAVGPSRRGRLAGSVLGTTAQRVLRASRVPVLLCRNADGSPPRRILFTTDLRSESRRTISAAARLLPLLGTASDAAIRLLLVGGDEVLLPPPVRRGPLREQCENQLEEFLGSGFPTGVLRLEPRVRLGLAGREIVDEAAEWGADLVMVGTRALTGGERLLLGSVAESVVTRAPCDVLVVPPSAGRNGHARSNDPPAPAVGSG